jgi:hypothetical protein
MTFDSPKRATPAPAADRRCGPISPHFPMPIRVNGRLYLRRSALDRHKAQLQAFALGVQPVEPPQIEPDAFVPMKAVEKELGVGRRTIGRRIAESAQAAHADQAA